MEQRERQVIDQLFGKLRQVEAQTPQRDAEAEAYIRQQVSTLPAAPYYMAQALLVQEQALSNLQGRVQELERQAAERPSGGGGFLSGLFGGGQPAPAPHRPQPTMQPGYMQQPSMHPSTMMQGHGSPWGGRSSGGGGFLAGAMQTALGVAGGMLVADAISDAFSGGATEAADQLAGAGADAAQDLAPAAFEQPAAFEEPAAFKEPAAFDDGGDFGDETI